MLHKIATSSFRSGTTPAANDFKATPQSTPNPTLRLNPAGLTLVHAGLPADISPAPSAAFDLLSIAAHKSSSFLAEAAVLVLVLALLDRFMLKGRMEIGWVVSAFAISLILLACSVVLDFCSRRWLRPR